MAGTVFGRPASAKISVEAEHAIHMRSRGYELNPTTGRWEKPGIAGTPTEAIPGAIAPETAGIPTAAPGAEPGAAPTDPMAMYRQALEGLAGGGAMLESSLADIEAGKKEAIGAGQQALVSAGLAGTTMMGGVPIVAERGAGRARLAARGQVEQLRLQTLASYAGLAQQAKLASAERQAALTRLEKQISAQKTAATTAQKAEKKRLETQIAAQRQAGTLAEMRTPDVSPIAGGGGQRPFEAALSRIGVGRSGLVLGTSPSPTGYESYVSGGVGGGQEAYSYGAHLTPDIPRTMTSAGPTTAYAQQFPSIYGQDEEPVPQW